MIIKIRYILLLKTELLCVVLDTYPIAEAQRYIWWSNSDTITGYWFYMHTLGMISHNVLYRAVTVDKLKTDAGQTAKERINRGEGGRVCNFNNILK